MSSLGEPWNTTWPSDGWLSTLVAAMEPLAPPRFSTITGWPSCLPSVVLTVRAITSDTPPAGYGTISVTGLAGKAFWANTVALKSRPPINAAVRLARRGKYLGMVCLLVDGLCSEC